MYDYPNFHALESLKPGQHWLWRNKEKLPHLSKTSVYIIEKVESNYMCILRNKQTGAITSYDGYKFLESRLWFKLF